MKKTLALFLFVISTLLVSADILNYDPPKLNMPELGADYYKNEFKSGSSSYSGRLRYNKSDNTVIKPNSDVLEILRVHRDFLIEYASFYPDVHPATIAACILAENTMNVTVSDRAQNYLAKESEVAFSLISTILGKDSNSVSIGLGQINLDAARRAEPYVKKIEGRSKSLTNRELTDEILTPRTSILYAGGIIQDAIDVYKRAGIDITERPDVQCTLYNIGRPHKRAQRTKRRGTPPKPNYFGFFVNRQFENIKNELKLNNSEIEPYNKIQIRTAEKNKLATEGPIWMRRNETLVKPMTLRKSYPSCDEAESEVVPSKILSQEVSGQYKTMEFHLACDFKVWSFVQLENGESGWLPTYELQKNSKLSLMTKKEFDLRKKKAKYCSHAAANRLTEKNKTCSEELKSILGNVKINPTSVQVLKGGKRYGNELKEEVYDYSVSTDNKIFNAVEKKKRAILGTDDARKLNLSGWDDPNNPWKDMFDWIQDLKECRENKLVCKINSPKNVVDMDTYDNTNSTGLLNSGSFARKRREALRQTKIIVLNDKNLSKKLNDNLFNNSSSPEFKQKVFSAVNSKKNAILRFLRRGKGLQLTGWDDPRNPHIDLFKWVSQFEQCTNCSLGGVGEDIVYDISNSGLLEDYARYRYDKIKNITVIQNVSDPLMELKSHLNQESRSILKTLGKTIIACHGLRDEMIPKIGYWDSFKLTNNRLVKFYNQIANVDDQSISNEIQNLLRTSINAYGDNCRKAKACRVNDPVSESWNKCNIVKTEDENAFLCDVNNLLIKSALKEHGGTLHCLISYESCYINNIDDIEKINKAADLDCTGNFLFNEVDFNYLLNSPAASDILKSKLVMVGGNSLKDQFSILFKDKCKPK